MDDVFDLDGVPGRFGEFLGVLLLVGFLEPVLLILGGRYFILRVVHHGGTQRSLGVEGSVASAPDLRLLPSFGVLRAQYHPLGKQALRRIQLFPQLVIVLHLLVLNGLHLAQLLLVDDALRHLPTTIWQATSTSCPLLRRTPAFAGPAPPAVPASALAGS